MMVGSSSAKTLHAAKNLNVEENPFETSTHDTVLSIPYPPYTICESDNQVNPPGFITELWEQLNILMDTDVDVVCAPPGTTFEAGIDMVTANTYPIITTCGLSSARMEMNLKPTIQVDTSGYAFAVLTENTESVFMALFSPLFTPIAVNLLAVLLLSHVLFANLIFITQHFGNSASRDESYSKGALLAFYFSVMGYDLSTINTSLGRLLAGVDTLVQSILMALYVGVVTVQSISGSAKDFDPAALTEYRIAAVPGGRSWDWVIDQGASAVEMPGGAAACHDMLLNDYADACCLGVGPLTQYLKENEDAGIAALPGIYSEGPVVMYMCADYDDELLASINYAIQVLREDGVIDSLTAKWLTPIEAVGWGTLDVEVAIWASVALVCVLSWLAIVIIGKTRETMTRRKVKAAPTPRLSV
ncbi:hypothetical protein KIPB_001871 [Kipferlia bialata]|uniref:Solute-binding protein family 3/N-terminal domain-containing protein n=1 Tax=Kipferlia bialata TaxID=797122 RepID=A0A9K3GFP5_9EUKA|nr:hypothetical protein KIPB_001871 [Kipferlia bialata]|eukprot:g1871.t1